VNRRCSYCDRDLSVEDVLFYKPCHRKCDRRPHLLCEYEVSARPTKFMQRLAVVLALAIITACVGVLVVLCGWHA
jgi:hypothetical protein